MADEKEVKKPGEVSKETKKQNELTEAELDKAAGGVLIY